MADKMMRIAGRGTDGSAKAVQTDNEGSPVATLKSSGVVYLHDNTESVQNGETINVSNYGIVAIRITGTFDATVSFLGAIMSTGYDFINAKKIDDGRVMPSTKERGTYLIDCRGLSYIQARVTSYTSGAVTVVAKAYSYASVEFEVPERLTTFSRRSTLPANETEILIKSVDKVKTIEVLELAVSDPTSIFLFLESNGDRYSKVTDRRGYSLLDLNVKSVFDNGSSLWELVKYDDNEKAYKISLKRPLTSDDFFTLRVSNTSSVDANVAVFCIAKQ